MNAPTTQTSFVQSGSSIIFVNSKEQIILMLRDDKPDILCPNCWDILGGGMESDEIPYQTIIREMKEEIEVDLTTDNFFYFKMYKFPIRTEFVFWKLVNFNIDQINLHEGQKLQWFSKQDIELISPGKIVTDSVMIINDFYQEKPYLKYL